MKEICQSNLPIVSLGSVCGLQCRLQLQAIYPWFDVISPDGETYWYVEYVVKYTRSICYHFIKVWIPFSAKFHPKFSKET